MGTFEDLGLDIDQESPDNLLLFRRDVQPQPEVTPPMREEFDVS